MGRTYEPARAPRGLLARTASRTPHAARGLGAAAPSPQGPARAPRAGHPRKARGLDARTSRRLAAAAALALAAAAVAVVREAPLSSLVTLAPTAGLVPASAAARVGMSLLEGIALATATLVATRVLLEKSARADALASALRPSMVDASDTSIVVTALATGIAEELLFRGALVPWLGVLPAAALFGVVHQVPGRGRGLFAAWAFVFGAALGAVFVSTGCIAGCVVAHVVVNVRNGQRLRAVA